MNTYIQIGPGESIAYKELTAPAIQDLLHLSEVGNHLLLVLSLEKQPGINCIIFLNSEAVALIDFNR